jgi:hypothetical protein
MAPDPQQNGVNLGNFGKHLAPETTKQMNTNESFAGWWFQPVPKICTEKIEVSYLNFERQRKTGNCQPVRHSLPSFLLNSFWRT